MSTINDVKSRWNKILQDLDVFDPRKSKQTTGSNLRVVMNDTIKNKVKTGSGKLKTVNISPLNNISSFVQSEPSKEYPMGGYVIDDEGNIDHVISGDIIEDKLKSPDTFSISKRGIEKIKKFERYFDKPTKNHEGDLFIGYGHYLSRTEDAQRYYLEGITRGEADSILEDEVTKATGILKRNMEKPLVQEQIDSLIMLIYNIGEREFLKSKVLENINNKNFKDAGKYFGLHNTLYYLKDSYQPNNLIRRRNDESTLFTTIPNRSKSDSPKYPHPDGPTRGFKNNNPGYIEKYTSDIGQWKRQRDSVYVQFSDARYGIRAITRRILDNKDRYNRPNLVEVISVWYDKPYDDSIKIINTISDITKIPPRPILNLRDEITLTNIVSGIIEYENGELYYDAETMRFSVREELE